MLFFIDNVEKILIEMLAVKNAGKNVKKLDFVVCVREEFFFPRERFQTFGTNIHPWDFEGWQFCSLKASMVVQYLILKP